MKVLYSEIIRVTIYIYLYNNKNYCLQLHYTQNAGHPSAPDRPTTSKNNIVRFNDSYSSVTVSWERPDTNNSRISRYVVSVNPQIALPGNGIIAATDPDFQDRQITVLLKHEQAYDIFVRADNCNNSQQGSRSSALHINIQGGFGLRHVCT